MLLGASWALWAPLGTSLGAPGPLELSSTNVKTCFELFIWILGSFGVLFWVILLMPFQRSFEKALASALILFQFF